MNNKPKQAVCSGCKNISFNIQSDRIICDNCYIELYPETEDFDDKMNVLNMIVDFINNQEFK